MTNSTAPSSGHWTDSVRVQVVEGVVRKQEALIRRAILEHAAGDTAVLALPLSELKRRCALYQWPNGESEFVMDGQPLIRFYPVRFETKRNRDGTATIQATQEYRKYGDRSKGCWSDD